MADLIIPAVSQVYNLDLWLGITSLENLTFHLFDNDITPDFDTVLTDFEESSYPGYFPVGATAPAPVADSATEMVRSGPIAVGFAGPSDGSNPNVYGWYCTNPEDIILIAALRFDGAPLVLSGPDSGPIFGVILRTKETTVPVPSMATALQLEGTPSDTENTDWVVTVTCLDQYGATFLPYAGSVSFALGHSITAGGDGARVSGSGGSLAPSGTLASGIGTFTLQIRLVGSPGLPFSCMICAGDGTIGGSMPRFNLAHL